MNAAIATIRKIYKKIAAKVKLALSKMLSDNYMTEL